MKQSITEVRMKEWIELIREANESGLTRNAWCEAYGINKRRFYYWQKKIREYALQNHPDLMLSASISDSQPEKASKDLPVFCELLPAASIASVTDIAKDEEKLPAVTPPDSAHIMLVLDRYQIYIKDSFNPETLSKVLSVIDHA